MIEKIEGFKINKNNQSPRIINIDIGDEILNKLIFPFNKFDITALEYKPFTRFTIAKSLDDLSNNKLSKLINKIIRDRNTGCFIIKPKNLISKIDDSFLVKLSTAVAHLIGNPNHDAMAGKYYARFHVKHEDKSDSYLRKAYKNMDLHTDGTYVKEKTDWLLMSKIEEKMLRVEKLPCFISMIGNIVMNYLMILSEKKIFFGALLKVKILIIKLNIQYFHLIKMVGLKFHILINFLNLKI